MYVCARLCVCVSLLVYVSIRGSKKASQLAFAFRDEHCINAPRAGEGRACTPSLCVCVCARGCVAGARRYLLRGCVNGKLVPTDRGYSVCVRCIKGTGGKQRLFPPFTEGPQLGLKRIRIRFVHACVCLCAYVCVCVCLCVCVCVNRARVPLHKRRRWQQYWIAGAPKRWNGRVNWIRFCGHGEHAVDKCKLRDKSLQSLMYPMAQHIWLNNDK